MNKTRLKAAERIRGWIDQQLDEVKGDATPLSQKYRDDQIDYVLADIDAKRRALEWHRPFYDEHVQRPACMKCVVDEQPEPWPCREIRNMATPFAGRVGYDAFWRLDPE